MSEIVLPANLTDCHALIRQLLTIIEQATMGDDEIDAVLKSLGLMP